jgi:hypothetical protein
MGRTMQKSEQLKATNPALHAKITTSLMELEKALGPDQAKAIEYGLVYYPEVVWELGQILSDDSVGGSMSEKIYRISQDSPEALWKDIVQQSHMQKIEKHVQARILQDRALRSKRVTSAPPPIVPPKGTASVPKDMYRTAEKSNASDYIKMRRAQNARAERD